MIALLAEFGGRLDPHQGRQRDKYGRRLGRLFVGDQDWAALAISEQLAVAWDGRGRRHDWCAAEG